MTGPKPMQCLDPRQFESHLEHYAVAKAIGIKAPDRRCWRSILKVEMDGSPFPIDMLRYDSCWPADETSAHRIMESVAAYGIGPEAIYVVKEAVDRDRLWTFGRWASFGARVHPLDEMEWYDERRRIEEGR